MRVQHDIQPILTRATRASGRRSGINANAAESVDDELLNLTGGPGSGNGAGSKLEPDYELPGQPVTWDYEVVFGPAAAASTTQDDPGAKAQDAALGIARLSQVNQRLGLPEEHPTPEQIAATEATLELARRKWVDDMGERQAAELEREGGSKGAFPSNLRRAATRSSHGANNTDYNSASEDDATPSRSVRDLSLFTNAAASPNGSGLGGRSSSRLQSRRSLSISTSHNRPGESPGPSPKVALNPVTVSTADAGMLRQACIIEKAKLSWLREENARLMAELEEALRIEKLVRNEKRVALHMSLESALG